MENEENVEPDSPNLEPDQIEVEMTNLDQITAYKTDVERARIVASFIPDEIIYNIADYSIRKYDAVLVLGDVSGFTDLSEQYNKAGSGGPSRLTKILNEYIGSMVQEIMRHNGDLLKFSGDAFLAMWKCAKDKSTRDIMSQVVACAIIIQRNYGKYKTDVGVILRVKLGIATGSGYFSIIGDEKTKHYVILGKSVQDVKLAEHSCSAGEVIVSPSAWKYVNAMEFSHEYHSDGKHVKITGCGETWREEIEIDEEIRDGQTEEDATESEDAVILMISDRTRQDADTKTQLGGKSPVKKKKREFQLRPSVEVAAKKNMKDAIRPFIIPVVMRGVDMGEDLDYLTEMREVVIMFLNIIPHSKGWETLIGLVDQTYKIVCSLVNAARGIVNKVSYFDKDLMMLIIFGLRGYKHELESQSALMCALEVRLALQALDAVRSASVGVTTGMAYCGVVGHVLRREYTVIGVPVNKGARLMVAYPGKVTCDREVFLHSKLDSMHFVLQEPKPLKGLHYVGPIYEYREKSVAQGITTVSKYPLLGRSMELEIFKQMVDNFVARKTSSSKKDIDIKNVLMMKGVPRIGKTRLLDEMLHSVQGKSVTVHKISLNPSDYKVPYKTIQLIFTPSMGQLEKSSSKEKEDKLSRLLQDSKYSKWMCCLNQVFNVNFDLSKEYQKGSAQEKRKGLESVLVGLLQVCFRQSQTNVCGVDDCDFMDENSWMMFRTLFETDCVLFIMTFGIRRQLPASALELTSNQPRVKYIDLAGIEKWYHAGLACQVIDVRAIPPELERIIQTKSRGNPGWIESYLTSMIQTGGIIIPTLPTERLLQLGLVYPPEEMMVRLPDEVRAKEAKRTAADKREDNWKMYATSYKDSVEQLPVLDRRRKFGKIRVCQMTPDFQREDVDTSVTIDAAMLQVYDELTSFEQLLVKCSCVMGEVFPRIMLMYIMNRPSQELRNIALAVKKLFEIRVIGCAKGDFSHGNELLLAEQHTNTVPIQTNEIICECKGLTILDDCKDLPKYASCGLMKFRSSLFRETTYSLLLDNQKTEFHLRAAKFIEKETRRCKSCGGGIFTHILRGFGQEAREFKIRDRRLVIEEELETEILEEPVSTEEIIEKKSRSASIEPPLVLVESRVTIGEFDEDTTTSTFPTSKCLMPRSRRRAEGSAASLTKTFSHLDFSDCQCPLILTTMYTLLLDHYRGTANFDKVVDIVLEFSDLNIASSNHPLSLTLLQEATNIIQEKKLSEDLQASWRFPCINGRIHTLRGYSFLETGRFRDALKELYAAMSSYGYRFPHHDLPAEFTILFQKTKLKFVLDVMPRLAIGRSRGYYAKIADQISECLALMYSLFKVTQRWKLAKLAAIWGLNKALQSNTNFSSLCVALSNLMDIAQHYGEPNSSLKLENYALYALQENTEQIIESEELVAIAKLYFAIFLSRILRADIVHGMSVAFKTLRICDSTRAVRLKLQLLPSMISILLLRQQISDCISLLAELNHASRQDSDRSARTWYFALCVVFHLETGFSYVPFNKCEQYFQEEGESMITLRDPDGKKRYFTCMWLWCLRNELWEAATVWERHINIPSLFSDKKNFTNVITSLYILEGKLLYTVGKLDMRDVPSVIKTFKDLESLVKHIANSCKLIKIALPRFHILNALYLHIRYHDLDAIRHLLKGKYIAQKQGNLLDLQWSEHTEKVWTGTITKMFKDFWKDHCQNGNLLEWQEGVTGNMVMFSFPIPKHGV